MKYSYPLLKILIIIFLLVNFLACKKSIIDVKEAYRNDFETGDLSKITGGLIVQYNQSHVLGYYNNKGFNVDLNDLPAHDVLIISFDLFIHDSWDGNNKGDSKTVSGPDLWQLKVDGDTYINTTFSNSVCNDVYCLQQSYPLNYPYNNNPGTGAFRIDLPGVCQDKGVAGGGTSLYKIEKVITHHKGYVHIEFKDLLKQSNAINPLCDESWSLDNLLIKTATLK